MATRGHAITVEELLALNDELRSLAKAGVPLEPGLRAVGSDLPGRLGRLADELSKRLERGESLETVLQDSQLNLPPVFCAVVAAGVRSGRLAAALESLSVSIRRTIELRRMMIVGAIYPAIVLLIATALFTFTWTKLFPVIRSVAPDLIDHEMPAWFRWLTWSVDHSGAWLFAGWVIIVLGGITWWFRSRGAAYFGVSRWQWLSFDAVATAGRSASFAEILALLIEHQVPIAEALSLAGAASSDHRVEGAARSLADRVRSGTVVGPAPRGLPPLMCWLILTSAPSVQVVKTLRQYAETLRERAQQASLFLGIYLPIFLSAAVGAVVAAYYVLLVMAPFYFLLYQLSQP